MRRAPCGRLLCRHKAPDARVLRQLREKVRLAQVLLKMNQDGASTAGQPAAPVVRSLRGGPRNPLQCLAGTAQTTLHLTSWGALSGGAPAAPGGACSPALVTRAG